MPSSRIRQLAQGAHCHLIPNERNGYVPHTLRHRVLFGYSVILILVKVLVTVGYVLLPSAAVYSSAITASNIVALTNAARSALGQPPLQENARLAMAAMGKAEDMVINQYFSHVAPDGKTPWDWIRGAGYDYRYAGENLAVHYVTAEEAHEGWMASPDHRRNIADGRFADVGVGVARGTYAGFDTVFVVEMFGQLKSQDTTASTSAAPPTPDETPTPAAAGVPGIPESAPPAENENPPDEPTVEGMADETVTPAPAIVSVQVVPETNAAGRYEVTVDAPDAEGAAAIIGPSSSELELDRISGLWTGSVAVPTDSGPNVEESLLVRVESEEGATVEPVATVMPLSTTQDVFVRQGEYRPFRLFGLIEIRDLRDAAFRFYLSVAILLGALLLITVFVKFEVQRHSVNAHVLLVMLLSLALAFI